MPMPSQIEILRPDASWLDDDTWACHLHLRSVKLPRHVERCIYHTRCGGVRPDRFHFPAPRPAPVPQPPVEQAVEPEATQAAPREPEAPAPPAAEAETCAWEGCEEPARESSKYCSRRCSNKNARARYKARKAA